MLDLKRRADIASSYVEFRCPYCHRPEVVYIIARRFCHNCGKPFGFNAEELEYGIQERVEYHFKKKEEDEDD